MAGGLVLRAGRGLSPVERSPERCERRPHPVPPASTQVSHRRRKPTNAPQPTRPTNQGAPPKSRHPREGGDPATSLSQHVSGRPPTPTLFTQLGDTASLPRLQICYANPLF